MKILSKNWKFYIKSQNEFNLLNDLFLENGYKINSCFSSPLHKYLVSSDLDNDTLNVFQYLEKEYLAVTLIDLIKHFSIEYKEGDIIYIIRAEEGAFGANNKLAKILNSSESTNNGKLSNSEGMRVEILETGEKWNIGTANIRKATSDEIKIIEEQLTFGEYTPRIENERVHYGCQSFDKNDLLAIGRLFSAEINASITIKGKLLTESIIKSLIKKL